MVVVLVVWVNKIFCSGGKIKHAEILNIFEILPAATTSRLTVWRNEGLHSPSRDQNLLWSQEMHRCTYLASYDRMIGENRVVKQVKPGVFMSFGNPDTRILYFRFKNIDASRVSWRQDWLVISASRLSHKSLIFFESHAKWIWTNYW